MPIIVALMIAAGAVLALAVVTVLVFTRMAIAHERITRRLPPSPGG